MAAVNNNNDSFSFPVINSIQDIKTAIAGASEFSEVTKGNLITYNYKFGHVDTFPDPNTAPDDKTRTLWLLRRECRGLIFDARTGELVARPYQKFFNINELDETDENVIEISEPHILLEKLDGFFISALLVNGQIEFASKTGLDNKNTKMVYNFLKEEASIRYIDFCEKWVKDGYTPVFEFISTHKKIVVEYKKNALVLTALRHRRDGTYLRYEAMVEAATQFDVPVVSAIRDSSTTMPQLCRMIDTMENIEGGVLRFDSGKMYKMKTTWYTSKGAGNSDLLCQEKDVWNLILNQEIDDVKARGVQRALRQRIEKFTKELYSQLQITAHNLSAFVTEIRDKSEAQPLPEPDFVAQIQHKPKEEQDILVQIFSGKDPVESVIHTMKRNVATKGKLERVRYLAGDLYFYGLTSKMHQQQEQQVLTGQ